MAAPLAATETHVVLPAPRFDYLLVALFDSVMGLTLGRHPNDG